MASTTERQLQQMINIQSRIEAMLEKKLTKKGQPEDSQPTTGTISTEFVKMANSLEGIEKESKKTNQLLEKLIDVSTYSTTETAKEITTSSKALEKLGKGTDKLLKVVQTIGNLPDKAVDKFQSVLMLSAFLNPKDGKPLADEKQFERAENASKSIMNIVKGIALLGVTMVAFSFVLPQIMQGFLGFTVVLAGLALAIFTTAKVLEYGSGGLKDTSPLNAIDQLIKGIALFGLTMILFSFVLPQIAKGFIGFTVVLAGLTLALVLVGQVLQWGSGGFKDTSPLGALTKLGVSIALFGLTMVVFSFVLPQIALGALGFVTVVGAISLSIFLMNKAIGGGSSNFGGILGGGAPTSRGKGPLASLAMLLVAVSVTAIVLVGVGYFAKEAALGALVMTLSILALTGVAALAGNKLVEQGAKNLIVLGGALAIFAAGLAIYAQLAADKLTWENLAMLGATIGVMALVGTVLGIPAVAPFAELGAGVLITLGGALAIFAAGLSIYAQLAAPKLTWENLAMLGATIGVMALVGTVLGIPAVFPFAILGAVALTAIGVALILFTAGLAIFAASKFGKTEAENLNLALRSTMAGFLGYKSLDDMGITAFVRVPAMIGGLLLAAAAMIPLSLALLPLTFALAKFKNIKWTQTDSESLNAAILGVTKGLTEGLKGVSWGTLWFGLNSLRNVGSVLNGLAEGVQAFANLTFNEYSLDPETGEMKITNKVKLTPADIAETGIAIGQVISAVTKPLAEFGEQMTGGSGAGFLGVNWGKMIAIKFGISSLQGIGNGLVNLAAGVQDWANMTITEWGIQTNKETGLNELVPIKKRPITDGEIKNATVNIANVLAALGQPLSEFGAFFTSDKQGVFGTKYKVENLGLRKGIEGLANIGTGLVNMADGIVKWANMEYTEFGIGKDKNTGLNVLMPVDTRKIKKEDLSKATYNIGYVLSRLVYPLSEFGKIFTSTEKGWFGSEYNVTNEGLITGIEQMANISNNLGTLADTMAKWSNLEYTEMEVHKNKDGTTVLQPKKVSKIGLVGILKAQFNIGLVLSVMAKAFVNYNNELSKGGWSFIITEQIKELGNTQKVLGGLADFLHSKWGDDKMTKSSENYKLWLYNTADPIIGKMLTRYKGLGDNIAYFDKRFQNFSTPVKSMAFSTFTTNIVKLARYATPFERFAKSFDKMSVSMGMFANNFKIMSPEGIQAFTMWTDTLLKTIEVGKGVEQGLFDKALNAADTALDSAFQFGKNMLGLGDSPTSDGERKGIIDETIKSQEKTDPQMTALMSAIASLQQEVAGLRTAINGTLDVNISGVDSTTRFKISQE